MDYFIKSEPEEDAAMELEIQCRTACAGSHADTAELLNNLSLIKNQRDRLAASDQLLIIAFESEKLNPELIGELVRRGGNPNQHDSAKDKTLLHIAVDKFDAKVVGILVEFGANFLRPDSESMTTPFDVALARYMDCFETPSKYTEREKDALEKMLNIFLRHELPSFQFDSFCYSKYFSACGAILENDVRELERALEGAKSIQSKCTSEKLQLLIVAIATKRKECAMVLLSKSHEAKSLLFQIIRAGDPAFLKFYVDRGFDIKIKNSKKKNALHIACENGKWTIVKALVTDYGFGLDDVDSSGQNPLFRTVAAENDDACAIIEFFIDHFKLLPNINAKDNRDKSVLDYARHKCKTYALLLENGASETVDSAHLCPPTERDSCQVMNFHTKCLVMSHTWATLRCQKSLEFDWSTADMHLAQKYNHELNCLNLEKISDATKNSPVRTLYDLLFLEPNEMAIFSSNDVVQNIYRNNENDFRNGYPLFGGMLNYQYRRGAQRQLIMNAVEETLEEAISSTLPKSLSLEIFRYFSDRELQKFELPKSLNSE